MGPTESNETGVAPANGGSQGNSAQPPEPVSTTGDQGAAFAFHFENRGGPFKPTATFESEDLNSPSLHHGHGNELAAILQVDPAAIHPHTAGHADIGQHPAPGHSPHDLLT
jgi:hypothetical protein